MRADGLGTPFELLNAMLLVTVYEGTHACIVIQAHLDYFSQYVYTKQGLARWYLGGNVPSTSRRGTYKASGFRSRAHPFPLHTS